MYKRFILLSACTLSFVFSIQAQTDTFQERFMQFRKQVDDEFESYWNEVNEKYADFILQTWERFNAEPAVSRPKEEKRVKPEIFPQQDTIRPFIDTPLPVIAIVKPVVPEKQPTPIAPIEEIPIPIRQQEKIVTAVRWGTSFPVRFTDNQRFTLSGTDNESIACAWKNISGKEYNNTVRDCLLLRAERRLNDWAYLCMLQSLSVELFGESNEAVLFMANVFCKSGYKMRLARSGEKLFMLFASRHFIYEKNFFRIEDECFYLFGGNVDNLELCPGVYPGEKPLSLRITEQPLLEITPSDERILTSKSFKDMEITIQVNENIMKLCSEYPASSLGDDFMTRWAMYANATIADDVKSELYPQLQKQIEGHSQQEAVNMLLNWVQTAFSYEYDEMVWGADRAFFAEETLFYPFCDCEDRSILFSHLVRDLVGLDVILVYYPGHLAVAVAFTENVIGDYITVDEKRFVVCDPTYINAPVGMSMPNLDKDNISVIKLDSPH